MIVSIPREKNHEVLYWYSSPYPPYIYISESLDPLSYFRHWSLVSHTHTHELLSIFNTLAGLFPIMSILPNLMLIFCLFSLSDQRSADSIVCSTQGGALCLTDELTLIATVADDIANKSMVIEKNVSGNFPEKTKSIDRVFYCCRLKKSKLGKRWIHTSR